MTQLHPGNKIKLKKTGEIKTISYHVRNNKESQGYAIAIDGAWHWESDFLSLGKSLFYKARLSLLRERHQKMAGRNNRAG